MVLIFHVDLVVRLRMVVITMQQGAMRVCPSLCREGGSLRNMAGLLQLMGAASQRIVAHIITLGILVAGGVPCKGYDSRCIMDCA